MDDPYPMFYVIGESAGRALAVQTDGSGKFRIGPVPVSARKWGVHAAHVDYSSARAGAFELGQDGIEVMLARGSTVRGRVVNAVDGSPLPNVFVEHPGWLATVDGGTYTDDDGAFTLSGVREGLHSFPFTIVDDRRMIRVERTSIEVDGVNDVSNYEMRFAPSASISGRVIDVSTGEGVADTHVVATGMAGQDQSPARASTDEDGYYELVGVPTGSVGVFVRATWGYLRTDPEAAELWEKTGLQYYYMNPVGDVELVEVVQGEVYEKVDLELDSKTVVRGRVVDDNGAPVASATVIGWPPLKQDNDHHGFDNVSDESMADGSFELRGLSDKDDVYLVVRAPGFLGAHTGPLAISESLPEQTLSLTPGGGAIHGTVVRDGAPFGGVRIECKRADYDPPLEVIVFTNPLGEFSIDALPRGPYKVRAFSSDGGPQEIELSADAPKAELRFSGENKTRRFRGIVTLDGEPFALDTVDIRYKRHMMSGETTDANGEFVVRFFDPEFTITACINDGPLYQQKIRHTVTAEPGEEVSARFDFVTPSKSP